jgi:hypothetical protein
VTALAMIAIVLAVFVAVALIVRDRRVIGAITVWLAITGIAALAGILKIGSGPPRVVVCAFLAIITGVVASRTRAGRTIIERISPAALIALQTFRLFVELVLWRLAVAGELPVRMTFEGRNVDILVGITAIPVAFLAYGGGRRWPTLAFAWHALSLVALVNIVAIAILSAPGPLQVFTDQTPNTIIGTFPFVWLPAFLVPVAFVSHVVGLSAAYNSARARR